MENMINYLNSPEFIIGTLIFGVLTNFIAMFIKWLYIKIDKFLRKILKLQRSNREEQLNKLVLYYSRHPERLSNQRIKVLDFKISYLVYYLAYFINIGFYFLLKTSSFGFIFLFFAVFSIIIEYIYLFWYLREDKILGLAFDLID